MTRRRTVHISGNLTPGAALVPSKKAVRSISGPLPKTAALGSGRTAPTVGSYCPGPTLLAFSPVNTLPSGGGCGRNCPSGVSSYLTHATSQPMPTIRLHRRTSYSNELLWTCKLLKLCSPIAMALRWHRWRHLGFVHGHLCLVVPLLLPLQAKGLPTKAAWSRVGARTWCEGWSVSEHNSAIFNIKDVQASPLCQQK